MAASAATDASALTEAQKAERLASNTYPIRWIFKRRATAGGGMGAGQARTSDMAEQMRKKYGELTMLDFPQFTRDHFPGVRDMDLWSSLFGDVTDDSMFTQSTVSREGRSFTSFEFDPSLPTARKWLDQLVARQAKAGVRAHHVSNNAPRNISDLDVDARKQGIAVAKKWLDACAQIGAKTMRVNTGGPRIVPSASTGGQGGYPRNDEIVTYLRNAVESFKEMADYGGKVGVKVTIENHWGLSADPTNIRIILDEVSHPFCEATPDFCNWEHEYLLYHGLKALTPYARTTVHAKYWDRWGPQQDVKRSVKVMLDGGYKGKFALEYEAGPWDGVEGAKYLMKEVMAAL